MIRQEDFYQLYQGLLSTLIRPLFRYKCDDRGLHVQVVQIKDQGLEVPSSESSQHPPTTKHLYKEAYRVALLRLFEDLFYSRNSSFKLYHL
ncbi:hypothetical protein IC582_003100 [Cucumis melo]